jgi:hypothetical protein
MKFSAIAILSTTALALLVSSDPTWPASKKFDRGTCLTLAKQRYGIHVGHNTIRAAADRCVVGGPDAL